MSPRKPILALSFVLFASLTALPARSSAQVGDFFDDSSELVLSNYRVVAERPSDGGLSEVDVAADLTNVGSATWLNAGATILFVPPEMQILQMILRFDSVPASGPVASSNVWTLLVPSDQVAGIPADFAEKRILVKVLGIEIPTYIGPVFFLDEATDSVFTNWQPVGPNDVLVFSESTSLLDAISTGDILLEDPLPAGYRSQNGLHSRLPRKVVSKTVTDNDIVQLEGAPLLPGDILNGTFSGSVGYSVSTGETLDVSNFQIGVKNCEDETHLPDDGTPKHECVFRGIPFRFNDLEISAGVKASGEVRFSAGVSSVEVRFRGLVPDRIVADLQLEYTASFEIVAEAEAEFDPKEKTLWSVPLPIFTVPIGGVPVSVSLNLDFIAGAQCDLRGRGRASVSQSVKTGVKIGFSGDEVVFDPYLEADPFHFTPPQVQDSSGLHLKGWAGLDATLIVNEIKGPFVKTKGYGVVKVEPFGDPWWSFESGVDVTAGVHAGFQVPVFGLELGFKDAVSRDWNYPIASFSSETSLGEGEGSGGGIGDPRQEGSNVRWATTLSARSGVYGSTRVHALANGDGLMISAGGVGVLARTSPRGEVIWQKSLGLSRLLNAEETPWGTIVVAGTYIKYVYLAELSADGSTLWQRTYEMDAETSATTFTSSVDPTGELSLYVAGFSTYGAISQRDPCIFRFDSTGRMIWSKTYVSPGADIVSCAHGAPDGGIVLAGVTNAAVADDASTNGLVFRVDEDGEVVWGTALASFWGGNFESISVSPEGQVWASGNASRTLRQSYPDIWVARLSLEDGTGMHTLVASDPDWEEYLDVDASLELPPTEPTAGGATAYDTGFAIEPFESGAIVAGSSGLGASKSALAFRLDKNLGVQWITLFDGPAEDVLTGVAPTGDGIFLAGYSTSFVLDGKSGLRAALLQKVPFEGLLDYDASVGFITRYAQPQLKDAPGIAEFAPGGTTRSDVTYEIETLALVPKTSDFDITEASLVTGRVGAPFGDVETPSEGPRFVRGDCNSDGNVNGITDATTILSYSFLGGSEPHCLAACDASGDGSIGGVGDAIYLLTYFFLGGAPPAAPFPECGVGALPGDELLGCSTPPAICAE